MSALDAPVCYAVGECAKCGSLCRVLVENSSGMEAVDVRCGSCRGITVLRDFEPVYGGCPEDA